MLKTIIIPKNIFLVGPMGVGKTTIGRNLAATLGMKFKDSDREIEKRTGASISLIFDLEGEAGFRKREQAMIDELTKLPKIVLATGGGVVLDEKNRTNLKIRGYVIYLYASAAQLVERTVHNCNRPLLQTDDPQARLEKIVNERHSLYTAVSDVVVGTEHRTTRQVLKHVLKNLNFHHLQN